MKIRLSKKAIYVMAGAGVLVVCAAVLVVVFVFVPQGKAISAVDARIREVEQALAGGKSSGFGANVSSLNEKLCSTKKNLSRYVISPEQASDLTVDIGKIAKAAGVQGIHSTNRMQGSYGPINKCRHIGEGRVQVKFKSSFSQFAHFINLLERYKSLIFIDYFKIKRSSADNMSHDVEIVLTFFVGQGSLVDIMAEDDSFRSVPGLADETESTVN